MKIVIAGENESKRWDDYIDSDPDSCVFQSWGWRDVVQSCYRHSPYYLMAINGSEVCGVLPLFYIRSRIFGDVLASCPYASSGAISASGRDESRALVEEAVGLARDLKAKYLELKSRSMTPHEGLLRHTDYVNYFIPLDKPEIMWRSSLKKKTRESVKRSQRSDLFFEKGHELLDYFYGIVSKSMRRMGTPVHSRDFYRRILEVFGSQSNIFIVKYRDTAISGSIVIRYRDEAVSLIRCSLQEYHCLRPNNFLYWEALKASYEAGAKTYDAGRSLAGSGSAKFKEVWGAVTRPLYYEYYLNGPDSMPKVRQDNPKFQAARWIWKHLPLSLTNRWGPGLIKSIP